MSNYEPRFAPCVQCGTLIEWACSDCKMDGIENYHVCDKRECRDTHDAADEERMNPRRDGVFRRLG